MRIERPIPPKRRKPDPGFTLIEVMVSVLILAILMGACFSSILFNRLTSMKSKEEAIAMDFLIHYVETVKALPFNEVVAGHTINNLLDGSGGAPTIRIPANTSWFAINTADYEAFHPDLLWLHNRNPKLRGMLTLRSVSGIPHDAHLNLTISWDAPLNRGQPLQVQLDLLRTKDL